MSKPISKITSVRDLPPGPERGTHAGHLGIKYIGVVGGMYSFRCQGCGETLFILPERFSGEGER